MYLKAKAYYKASASLLKDSVIEPQVSTLYFNGYQMYSPGPIHSLLLTSGVPLTFNAFFR